MSQRLTRSIGVKRAEASGDGYLLVNNDTVEETAAMGADSADLIVTSVPFATQYEYTPSYNDFGHTADNSHFWAQMDFLAPELRRVLAPGAGCRDPCQGPDRARRHDRAWFPDRPAVPRGSDLPLHPARVRVPRHEDRRHGCGQGEQPDLPAGVDGAVQGRIPDGRRNARVPAHLPQSPDRQRPRVRRLARAEEQGDLLADPLAD